MLIDIETLKIEDIETEMEFEQKDLPVEPVLKEESKERQKEEDIEEELDMIPPDMGQYYVL